jgi:hypothetical protein
VVMPNSITETPLSADGGPEERRPASVVAAPIAANPEASDRPGRRTFTGPEKLRILKEADQAAGTGAIWRDPASPRALLVSAERMATPA